MKKADWILDYDMHTDSTYCRPGCPKCNAPVGLDGKCYSCGKEYRIDDWMRLWFEEKCAKKTEMVDCIYCGGKGTMEKYSYKNHVSGEWQVAYERCTKCGTRIIV